MSAPFATVDWNRAVMTGRAPRSAPGSEIVHLVRGEDGEHVLSNCDLGGADCEPTDTLECRLMEAFASAFGVALCAAPCSADGTETGTVGACPPCKAFDGTAWYVPRLAYDLPIQRAVGVKS